MRFVRWNSFTIIGAILLVIGIYGKIKGSGFEFDAGVPAEPLEAVYYVVVGALFMVNGYIFGKPLVAQNPETPGNTEESKTPVTPPVPTSPSSPVPTKPA